MQHFKEQIIHEIKCAREGKVEMIVKHSVNRLRENNVNEYLVQHYVAKMLYKLEKITEEKTLDSNSRQNVTKAIEVFKKVKFNPVGNN